MNVRKVSLKKNTRVTPCPKCGNNTSFTGYSDYCAEDCCNVWVVCQCGYDPTADDTDKRLEDVWGGVSDDMIMAALSCWNDALPAAHPTQPAEGE